MILTKSKIFAATLVACGVAASGVGVFGQQGPVKAEVDRHISALAASQRLPGVEDIRVPGQGRVARRTEREQNGVPLSASLVAQVDEVAKSLGIAPLGTRA